MKESSVKEFLLWLLRLRWRVRVTGVSMLPVLAPGDEVFVDRLAYRRQRPSPQEIVVTQHPTQPDLLIIKRIQEVGGDGRLTLMGDNPEQSSDSRVYGRFAADQVLGRVTSRLP